MAPLSLPGITDTSHRQHHPENWSVPRLGCFKLHFTIFKLGHKEIITRDKLEDKFEYVVTRQRRRMNISRWTPAQKETQKVINCDSYYIHQGRENGEQRKCELYETERRDEIQR